MKGGIVTGARVLITWLRGDAAYGRTDARYEATAVCVDWMGTLTFVEDDGRTGVAGAGSWELI